MSWNPRPLFASPSAWGGGGGQGGRSEEGEGREGDQGRRSGGDIK